jgi:pimeloyl-ACP methyl ester carboxylesterase
MSTSFLNFKEFRTLNPTLNVALDTGSEALETIIFLHGVAATSATWYPMLQKIDQTKYRIIALDLLGFGGSPSPSNGTYTVEEHARYVQRTIKKMNVLTPFKIVGHSMGSLVTANYCYRWPNDVYRAYYVGIPLYQKTEKSSSFRSRVETSFLLKGYTFFRTTKKITIASSRRFRRILNLKDGIDVNTTNWDAFRLSMEKTIQSQDTYREIAARQTTPAHIIYGTRDEFIVRETIKRLVSMKHVEEHVVNGADHRMSDKLSDEVARIVQST